MKAKRNRYDLSLWDVRKLQLYGSTRESVQNRNSQIRILRLLPKINFRQAARRTVLDTDHWLLIFGCDNSTSTKTE